MESILCGQDETEQPHKVSHLQFNEHFFIEQCFSSSAIGESIRGTIGGIGSAVESVFDWILLMIAG